MSGNTNKNPSNGGGKSGGNVSGGNTPQIQLTDRQLKLRNYHARKVAEQKMQMEIMQKIHNGGSSSSNNGGSNVSGGSSNAGGGEKRGYGRQQQQPQQQTPSIHSQPSLSSSTSRQSKPPQQLQPKISQHTQQTNSSGTTVTAFGGNKTYGSSQQNRISSSSNNNNTSNATLATTSSTSSALPTPYISPATVPSPLAAKHSTPMSSTSFSTTKPMTKSSAHSASNGLLEPSPSPAPSATSAASATSLSKSSPMQTIQLLDQTKSMTTHQKAAFLASLRHGNSNNGNSNGNLTSGASGSANGNDGASSTKTTGGMNGGYTTSSNRRENTPTLLTAVDTSGSNSGEKYANNNNDNNKKANSTIGTAALDNRDKMKRMFAARRRKAQLEMTNSSSTGGESTGVATSEGEHEVKVEKKDKNKRVEDNQVEKENGEEGREAREGRTSTSSVHSTNSAMSGSSSFTANTASTAASTKSSHSMYSLSSEKRTSSSSMGSHGSTATSSSSSSFVSRKAYERFAGRVGSSGSENSRDNSNCGDGDEGGGKLPPVKEESSHSLASSSSSSVATARISNNALTEMESKQKPHDKTASKDPNNGGVGSQKGGPESILRQSLSKDSTDGKSVRFQLPTTKVEEEPSTTNPQCSPPRPHKAKSGTNGNNLTASKQHNPGIEKNVSLKVNTDVVDGHGGSLEEEDDMEYVLFVAGLKREVAGDHTELWSSFQSLLGRPMADHVPLYQSYVEDKGTSSISSTDDAKRSKKKKKVRMDPKTQQSLTSIHKHLMENDRIKYNFMTSCSQLVNDKNTLKDRTQNPSSTTRSSSSASVASTNTSSTSSIVKKNDDQVNPTSFRSSKSALSKSASLQLTQDRNGDGDESHDEGFQDKNTRDSKRASWINSYKKKKSIYMSAYRSSSVSSQSGRPLTPTSESSKQSFSCGDSKSGKENSDLSKTKKVSWLEALKKKQKSLRLKQKVEMEKQMQVVVDEKIEDNFTQQISPRKKPKLTPTNAEEENTPPHPWGHIQLKSTPKRESFFGTHRDPPRPGASRDETDVPKEDAPAPKVELFSIGDVIKLDDLPERAFPSKEESASFPLMGMKEPRAGEAPENIAIVGKSVIVTARCIPGSHGKKASVLWWCHRHEVRALTLNAEATGADLSLKNGRPSLPLAFHSADVCLEFAQAYYRGPAKADGPNNASEDKNDENSNEPSLTKDEESLLDRYRQFSHSDRQKLKLTCSSPKGETEGVEVALTSSSNSPDSNESTAEKFRQMIRMGVPVDAVRHKMTTEGVDATTISAILDRPPSSSENGDSTNLSEEDEAISTKFRKMLKMKVPPEAVRHKMTMEGVDAKIISAVLDEPASDEDQNKLTDEEEAIASKFRKMLKMKVPPEAVRHKMVTEGVDAKIISAVFDEPKSNENPAKLTDEEEGIASKFRKMLKMKVPPEAVRHKMTMEGVDGKIVSAVLDDPASDEDQNKLTDEEEATASKFRKMLKMKVPPEAVRHKMTIEGVDEKIIKSVLAAVPEPSANATESGLSSEEEVIAAKYRRMLKMTVPMEAVKHKMVQDQVDLKIVSAVTGETGPDAVGNANFLKKNATPDAPELSEEDEQIASKYRSMLKVCIPKDAVRHKMKQEGVSEHIVEAVLGNDAIETPAPSKERGKSSNSKTIKLHWTTTTLAPELLKQSIFARTEQKKRKLATINPEESDIKKLEELFQKKSSNKNAMAKGGSQDANKLGSEMAKLLDITRANNIAIGLKAFSDFSFRSLAETIDDLDPESKIVGERVQFIPNLLPTPKEIMAIKKFKGEDDKLITAELFFRQLVPIKRIEDKVKVMQTMSSFEEHVEEARAGFKTLQEVCRQVMNSDKLISILEMVLNIGNFMNEGTLNGGVEAFKFESLSKLSQTKSSDGKTTVLDYIVETFIEKGERETLFITSEFPDIQESSRLSISDLINDISTLRSNFQLCKTELTKMKNDQTSKRVTRSMTKKFKDESEPADPRQALFAAIKARGTTDVLDEKKPPANADPRQALFAAIRNKSKPEPHNNDEDTCDTKNDSELSRGVHKLQEFLTKAKTVLSIAEQDRDAAVGACKGLAVYCGEEGGERAAGPLLQILCDFATSLEIAVKKHDAKKEAEKRKEAARKKKEAEAQKQKDKENENQSKSLPTRPLKLSSMQPHVGVTDRLKKKPSTKPKVEISIKPEKESRVVLVNRMLSEAPDSVKTDFLRGVTYNDTDNPILKKIYEKEGMLPPKNT